MEDQRERRLGDLEKRVTSLEKDSAIVGVEFLSVKSDLKDIKDSLNWVTKLIIGALILAVIGFVVSGGIAVV